VPSLDQVKAFREAMYNSSTALIDKKGADYNRDQQVAGDTLFNLRVAEVLGIVPSTEEGILVRLSDKFMRLISLTKPGRDAAVKDESVLDTIRDIHNYVDYLGLIWQERRLTIKVDFAEATQDDSGYVHVPPRVSEAIRKAHAELRAFETSPAAFQIAEEDRLGSKSLTPDARYSQ